MLREEQAAELLQRCERIAGKRLEQIRGNLRKSESRSAAILELLVLEEVSKIGKVDYEPFDGGSPDILLMLPGERKIWIEVAFLYPRFWKQERQSDAVAKWITEEATKRGISPFKVSCNFDGDRNSVAGPIRTLPNLHERKKFLKEQQVCYFFERINRNPWQSYSIKHAEYSVEFTYSPEKEGPYILTGGGPVQEAPKTVKEHAVYRVLKAKARQHKVEGPRLVWIGSDQSPVLSGLGTISVRDAVIAAFSETQSIGGAIVLNIEDSIGTYNKRMRNAEGDIYINSRANECLTEEEVKKLCSLNFNRWDYFFRLKKHEQVGTNAFRRASGSLTLGTSGCGVRLEIPSNLLIDSLAGKTNLIKEYARDENDTLLKCIKDGWIVRACSWKEGDIEAGQATKVVLELEPPSEPVYWPNEK